MTDYVLAFEDYSSPPLTANQRLHWFEKAKRTRQVRSLTAEKAAHIPPMDKIAVQLVWFVNTSHRRDVDNVVPTLKAMCDGLVDAGVVPDDVPEFMEKRMPTIHQVKRDEMTARMTLIVTEVPA